MAKEPTKPADGSSKSAGAKSPVMFSAAVNAEHSRKYGFDGTGVCKVTAKIVSVPPPAAFLEWVQDTLVGGKK